MLVNNLEKVGFRRHFYRGNMLEYDTIITIDGEKWMYSEGSIEPDTEDHTTASVEAINPNGDQAILVWRSQYDDIEYDGWDYWFDWDTDLEKVTIYEYGYKKPMTLILFGRNCSASAFITSSGYLINREDMESVADMLDIDIDEISTDDISGSLCDGTALVLREGNSEDGFVFEVK